MADPTTSTTQLLEAADFGPSSSTTTGTEKGDFIAQIIGCIVVLVIIVAALAHFGYFSKKKEPTDTEKALVILTNFGNGKLKLDDTKGNDTVKTQIAVVNKNLLGVMKNYELVLRQLDKLLNDADNKDAYNKDGTLGIAQESVKIIVALVFANEAMITSANEIIVKKNGEVTSKDLFSAEMPKGVTEGLQSLPDKLKTISKQRPGALEVPDKMFD
jgi:hypothetical protein